MDEDSGSEFFERHLGRLKLSWPETEGDIAFRAAQLGATLTLSGHFQTSDEPAQAVLPTGVGKTAVMCALPFLVPMRRLLVVVPTRLLRDQIGGEFATLETLRAIGAIETDERPRVHQVEHRLASADAWERLREFDVVVGTPPVLSPTYPDVASPPAGIFDFLVFDEAHHLPATTWTGVLDAHGAPAALLTATPFRRDRKLLRGRLVYHYSLRQAMEDGVYATVTFVPIDAEPDADREIAEAAKGRLEAEPHRSEGSLLLVRTDRVEHARKLVELYGELDVSLGLITYEHAARTVRRTLAKLRDGQLQGVASVGALVEGFDLPKLKIAAYHRPHRSLPPTLQFVGRIARVTGGQAAAELIAVRGAVTDETAALYREDVAWAELLPAIADAAVEWERDKRVYLAEAHVSVASDDEISPSAITPRRTALVFDVSRCADIALHASIERIGRLPVIFRFVDSDGAQLALITARRISPEWLESDVLDTYEYQLILAVHDAERQLLFVSADSDTTARALRESVGADAALQLDPHDVNRYLSGRGVRTYSSIGMRTAFAASARQASYRMVAGSGVEGAISAAESRGYALGHVIGRRDEGGELQGMGVSFKRSKIWETAAADSLLEFRHWCEQLAQILSAAGAQETRAPHLQLALPRQLRAFPERPIAAIVDHRLLQGDYYVTDGGRRIDLITLESEVDRISDDELELTLGADERELWRGRIRVDGGVHPVEDERAVRFPGAQSAMSALFEDYPPTFYFADGSSTWAGTLFELPEQLPPPPAELFDVWDWADTHTGVEAGEVTDPHAFDVQGKAVEMAAARAPDAVVIVDHGARELADIIAIDLRSDTARVTFYHCKASTQEAPGARLDDLQEVLSQAVRSGRWTAPHALWRELARRLAERPNLRIVRGDPDRVAETLGQAQADPPAVEVWIWVVQPGLSGARMANWQEGQTLISSADEWCRSQNAILRLAISP